MKITLVLISLFNGLFMLADGIYLTIKGNYIGSPRSQIFTSFIESFNPKIVLILFGIIWLFAAYSFITSRYWRYFLIRCIAFISLLCWPIVTFLSILVFLILYFHEDDLKEGVSE